MIKKQKQGDQKQTKPETEVEDYKNKYLRALADYHNLEKRISEQSAQIHKRANRGLLLQFLDILDSIESAQLFLNDPGLKLIHGKFIQTLKSEGVEQIEALGKEYDPYVAECIEVISGDKDNVVVDVVQKGYKQYGDVIRPARVKVTKKI